MRESSKLWINLDNWKRNKSRVIFTLTGCLVWIDHPFISCWSSSVKEFIYRYDFSANINCFLPLALHQPHAQLSDLISQRHWTEQTELRVEKLSLRYQHSTSCYQEQTFEVVVFHRWWHCCFVWWRSYYSCFAEAVLCTYLFSRPSSGKAPGYIRELLQPQTEGRYCLQSNSHRLSMVPKTSYKQC